MTTQMTLSLVLWLSALPGIAMLPSEKYVVLPSGAGISAQDESANVQITYDKEEEKTTVRLTPVQISTGQDKYVSLHMSPAFSFPGRRVSTPAIIDFELQTVVKGRLSSDLYVVFVVDGKKVFLSSNRWSIKRPVAGRLWQGERLVFRMPYETFVKLTKAEKLAIRFDAVSFSIGETQRNTLRKFLDYMKPADTVPDSNPR